MTQRSTRHSTFVIERRYDAPPARVFNAFADPKAKSSWFTGPEDWEKEKLQLDFKVGGRERISGRPVGGQVITYDALYQDIVPNERIVYTYEMYLADNRISVSLATVQLEPAGPGTRMIYTEQAVHLDGYDTPEEREKGTQELFDKLERSLGLGRESAGAGRR